MVYWKIDSYLTVRVLENRLLFNSMCTGKYPLPLTNLKLFQILINIFQNLNITISQINST